MEYDVITASNLFDLTKFVNQKIKEGWEPIGGLAIVWRDYGNSEYWNYNQAIIKKEN